MSSVLLSLWGGYCAFQKRLVFILSHTFIVFRPVKCKNCMFGEKKERGEREQKGKEERREAMNRKTKDAGRWDMYQSRVNEE